MKSEVIAFRLNPSDLNFPDDGKALEILTQWRAAGHADRAILTHALLCLEGQKVSKPSKDDMVAKLFRLSERLEALIEHLESLDKSPAVYTEGENAGKPVDFGIMSTILGGLQHRSEDEDDE